jgi:two-component system chemotaxis response regulator CheB
VTNIAGRLKRRIRDLRECPVRLRVLPERGAVARLPAAASRSTPPVKGLIAIGTSTGGPQALELLLGQLPADAPPIVIVQHMPATFTRLFAERLNEICPMQVLEATAGQELTAGVAYLAPGDRHLSVEQHGGRLRTATRRSPLVHHQRPAVDVLFHSLAKVRGVPIVGILLTGMGRDGADGMVALRRAGQPTIAEDSRSCVVFGMPREAIARGGASHIAPLEDIPALIFSCLRRAAEARQTSM